jgi:hypothetical protein
MPLRAISAPLDGGRFGQPRPARVAGQAAGLDGLLQQERVHARPLAGVLLGPQEPQDGPVGRARRAQPSPGVGQHQADPVDAEQAHARVQHDLHDPVEVGGRVEPLQRRQVAAAGAVLGHRLLDREGRVRAVVVLGPAQQPAQRRQPAVVVAHRLDGDDHGDDLAVAPPQPQRPAGHPLLLAAAQVVHHRPEPPAVAAVDVGGQRLAGQEPLGHAEQRRRRPVGLADPGHRVGDQVGDRGRLEQLLVALALGLQRPAGGGQLVGLLAQLPASRPVLGIG